MCLHLEQVVGIRLKLQWAVWDSRAMGCVMNCANLWRITERKPPGVCVGVYHNYHLWLQGIKGYRENKPCPFHPGFLVFPWNFMLSITFMLSFSTDLLWDTPPSSLCRGSKRKSSKDNTWTNAFKYLLTVILRGFLKGLLPAKAFPNYVGDQKNTTNTRYKIKAIVEIELLHIRDSNRFKPEQSNKTWAD